MKTKIWLAAVALSIGLFVASCNNDDNDNQTPQLNQTDINFINAFTQGNLNEIALNQAALDSGTDAQIANYAQTLIQDHQAAQKQLDSIASRFNLTLPTAADSATLGYRDSLYAGGRGMAFDSSFIANQIVLHDQMLSDLNDAATRATETTLKNYANQQIPIVTNHRTMADSIRQHL